MKVWVCQVRRGVFVGGESQRCRHSEMCEECGGAGIEDAGSIKPPPPAFTVTCSVCNGTGQVSECGEMELIGGEPVEWCVEHGSVRADDWDEQPYCWQWSALYNESTSPTTFAIDCQFVSQVRVGP